MSSVVVVAVLIGAIVLMTIATTTPFEFVQRRFTEGSTTGTTQRYLSSASLGEALGAARGALEDRFGPPVEDAGNEVKFELVDDSERVTVHLRGARSTSKGATLVLGITPKKQGAHSQVWSSARGAVLAGLRSLDPHARTLR